MNDSRLVPDAVVSRRTALILGAAGLLAACGSDSKKSAEPQATAGTGVPDLGALAASSLNLVQRFSTSPLFVPGEVRLAMSLASTDGMVQNLPATLAGEVVDDRGARVGQFRVPVRREGLPVPYFAPRVTIAKPGTYTVRVDVGGKAEAAFQVFDPKDVVVPYLGATLAGFDTPTADNHRGVEPYCTLEPAPCPFHSMTLTQAIASGKPVLYMIGTPAHCSTGACTPGLQFLVAAAKSGGLASSFAVVHAEVYTDNLASTVAPAVTALKLDYEPVVYATKPGGLIVDRLDAVWDATELGEVLARVGAS